MTSLFVSHSGRDRAATEQVRNWLRAEGYAALFVDFDPEAGIHAGRDWERELYVQLRRSDGVIFLASAASTRSRWCFAEVSLARALGRPVFPVRIEPGAKLDLVDDVQWVDLAEGDVALDRLASGLRRAGLDPADSFSWDPTRSPYPGLRPFEAADAAVFFGRGPEVSRLFELLQPTLQRGPGRFVTIVGPSGSGKSSLLRAGLLPRMERLGARWVVLPPLRPGSDPTARLAAVLGEAFAASGDERSRADVAAALQRGPEGLADLAGQLAELSADPGSERRNVLVVVDQTEELLTFSGPYEQQAFLSLLVGALRRERSPLWVVATVRSEFLSTAPERAGLAEAIDDPLVVEPLSRSRLSEVIAGPARRAGLEFEPGLVERMVEDTAGGDALPLLAYTLGELYDRVGPEGRITSADYEGVGGVVGALDKRADQVLDELTRHGVGAAVMPTLLKLAAVERRGEPTRRRVERRDLAAEERLIIDAFVEARLLTSSGSSSDRDGSEGTVDVAHEALLRQWPPLRTAIDEAHEWLERRSELDRLAADWEQSGRDESFLLRGGRLAVFDRWAGEREQELGPLERCFLDSSRELAARESETVRRSNRRLRILAGGLAAFLVIALVAGAVAWQRNQEAQTQARLALAWQQGQWEANADRLVDSQPHTAILAGLHALSIAPDDDAAQPAAGLVTALARVTHASRTLYGHTEQAQGVAFSSDGRLLASGSSDGTVRIWDPAIGQERTAPLMHGGEVFGVAFTPDDRLLASGGLDGRVRMWDPVSGTAHGVTMEHGAEVWGVAFSPDGRVLASGGGDGQVRMWDTASQQPHGAPLTGVNGAVYGLAFSSASAVAAAGEDGVVYLWDARSEQLEHELMGHQSQVFTVAFSPDGGTLASGDREGSIRLWDARTGEALGAPLPDQPQEVRGLAFSPDGQLLASSNSNGTATLWSVATRQPTGQAFIGHTKEVQGLAFSPEGRALATAGWDSTVRVWEVAETPSVSQVYRGHVGEVHDVAVSPDGRMLATASADGTARLWDLESTRQHGPAMPHDAVVTSVAFSPDGRILASVSEDGVLKLWEPQNGEPLGAPVVVAEEMVLHDVIFSPDGRSLAVAAADGSVQLWNVGSRQRMGKPLAGHDGEVSAIAFSPDGARIASAGTDTMVVIWDVAAGRPNGEPLAAHGAPVYSVAFSPDGRVLASGGDEGNVLLWDPETGAQLGEALSGHTEFVNGVAFSSDGRSLASTGSDGTVRVWDVASRRLRTVPLSGHGADVMGVAFTPDGEFVASASWDATARLWNWGFSSWAETGCGLINRNLTMDEWETLVPDLPYERTCPNLPSGIGAPPDAPASG